jgi:hypothetical protein
VMVEIEAHCYLNAELLALASGRGRATWDAPPLLPPRYRFDYCLYENVWVNSRVALQYFA